MHGHPSLKPSNVDILHLHGCRLADPCFRLHRFRLRTQPTLNRMSRPGHEIPGVSCVRTAMPTQAFCSRYCEKLQTWASQLFTFFSLVFSVTTQLLGGHSGMDGAKVIHRYPSNIHPYFSTCCFHLNEL